MGERHGEDEIEDAGQQQRRQVAGDHRLVLPHAKDLALGGEQAEEIDEARILDIADELVDQRRQNPADALRHDDEAHALPIAHRQRPARLHLAAIDALDAGAENLADIGAGDQAKRQDAERIGRRAEEFATQAGEPLPDQEDGDDGRQAAKDIGIDAGGNAQPGRARNAHDRQKHADDHAEHGGCGGQDQRILQADHDHGRQHLGHRIPVEEAATQVFKPVHQEFPSRAGSRRGNGLTSATDGPGPSSAGAARLTSWEDIRPASASPGTTFHKASSRCRPAWPRAAPC